MKVLCAQISPPDLDADRLHILYSAGTHLRLGGDWLPHWLVVKEPKKPIRRLHEFYRPGQAVLSGKWPDYITIDEEIVDAWCANVARKLTKQHQPTVCLDIELPAVMPSNIFDGKTQIKASTKVWRRAVQTFQEIAEGKGLRVASPFDLLCEYGPSQFDSRRLAGYTTPDALGHCYMMNVARANNNANRDLATASSAVVVRVYPYGPAEVAKQSPEMLAVQAEECMDEAVRITRGEQPLIPIIWPEFMSAHQIAAQVGVIKRYSRVEEMAIWGDLNAKQTNIDIAIRLVKDAR